LTSAIKAKIVATDIKKEARPFLLCLAVERIVYTMNPGITITLEACAKTEKPSKIPPIVR
jgi:hypothetical protein